jgi:hypothetical protein
MQRIITAALWMAAIVHVLAVRAWPHLRAWLFGASTTAVPQPKPEPEPAVDYASLLEALTVKDLRATCVTLGLPSRAYRAARKADLIALLADLHVNPLI